MEEWESHYAMSFSADPILHFFDRPYALAVAFEKITLEIQTIYQYSWQETT